ncbi:hypothetical protein, partial [Escherichia coli]|uniref:hypothetical protein n=1 Tax=Escherichia coli TaxID=562 RepID=UPI0002A458AB
WTAAKYQLLAATRFASGNTNLIVAKPMIKEFDSLEVHKVNIGLFTPTLDAQTIANMITNWDSSVGVAVQADAAGNTMHQVYVGKVRVASIYPEYITQFTGGKFFKAQVKDIKVNKKSISFNLVSVDRY